MKIKTIDKHKRYAYMILIPILGFISIIILFTPISGKITIDAVVFLIIYKMFKSFED